MSQDARDHTGDSQRNTGPSQSDVFAAAQPFGTPAGPAHAAMHEPFLGVDAFNPAGPVPLVSMPNTALEASCLDVHRSLSFYLDGELAVPQQAAVASHLAVCGSCQTAQAFQMQVRSTIAAKALDPMPDDVRARITKALGFE